MKRTFVIGDIHGGLKALKQVLQKAEVTNNDTLIFLGDYVDGWGESAQVISYVMDLSKWQECIFIKGNHDVWCENWLRTGNENIEWLNHGGRETMASYIANIEIDKKTHLDFFEQMKYYFIDAENRLFIHAGFRSLHGPQQEFKDGSIIWDRTLWQTAISSDKDMKKDSLLSPNRLMLYNEILIGHTPTTNYGEALPMQGGNVWNIDTGAAFKGKLTIMNVDTKQYWQSDFLPNLYPAEKGRNK